MSLLFISHNNFIRRLYKDGENNKLAIVQPMCFCCCSDQSGERSAIFGTIN